MVPEGWQILRLSDLASVSTGGTPRRDMPQYWGGHIPWVTTKELNSGEILTTAETITEAGVKNSAAKLYPAGSILMAMYGQGQTRGRVAKLGIPAATNQACAVLQVKGAHVPEYLFQFLVSRYEHIRGLSNEGAQKNLTSGIIKDILVPTPPPPEQKRIAQILSISDRAVATAAKRVDVAEQYARTIGRQLLSSKVRLDSSRASWMSYRLGELCSRLRTQNNGRLDLVLTISAQRGLVKQEDFFKKRVASETLEQYTVLSNGQFAYNKSYSAGYPMGAIKRLKDYDVGVVTPLYICFEVSDLTRCLPQFLEYFFDFGLLNRGLSQIATEGGRAHGLLNVKPSEFFDLRLSLPPLEEQRAIAKVCHAAAREVDALKRTLANLEKQRTALMQQLLTGRLRLSLPEVSHA